MTHDLEAAVRERSSRLSGFHALPHGERRALVARLKDAGDAPLSVGPRALAQIKLLTRPGTWQEGRYPEPVLAGAADGEVRP